MNLIERYIHAFRSYLPEEIQDDAENKLRSFIDDSLKEYYSEADAYQVLKKLGDPRRLAEKYHPKKKYLIGPAYYDTFIWFLKNTVFIFSIVSVVLYFISNLIQFIIHYVLN